MERRSERSRGWLITVQAPRGTDEKWRCKFPEKWEEEVCYRCQSYEKGKSAETIHTHILVYFRALKLSRTLAKEIICCNKGSEVDVESLKGKWSEAREYVMKQDVTKITGRPPVESGKCPRDYTRKEERKIEIENVVEAIKEKGLKGALEENAEYIMKYPSGCKLVKEIAGKRSVKRTVMCTIVWGDAGTGKSTWVADEAEKKWGVNNVYNFTKVGGSRDTIWFNGYSGEKCLIMDDVSGRTLPYEYMIKITGNDPMDVEFKGGREAAQWEEIYITSNYNPMNWYTRVWEECEETRMAFFRRMNRIIHVFKNEEGEVVWKVEKDDPVTVMREDFHIEPQWETTPRWIREERRCTEETIDMRDNDANVLDWNRVEEEETEKSGDGVGELGYLPPDQHDTPGEGMYWGGGDDIKIRRGCKTPGERDRELLKSQVFHLFCDEFNKRRAILGASELCWEEIATGVREGEIKYDEKEWMAREYWRNVVGNPRLGDKMAEEEADLFTWMEREFGVVELE